MDFERFLGRRVLIVGEVGSGKTLLLSRFLDYLVERGLADDVTVIEMAPKIGDVGGILEDYTRNVFQVRYLKPWRIFPPRILGETREHVLYYAKLNFYALKPLLSQYLQDPSEILLVNDITIYLHAGDVDDLIDLMEKSETFTATAYEGERLSEDKGSGITERERRLLNRLKQASDEVVRLG